MIPWLEEVKRSAIEGCRHNAGARASQGHPILMRIAVDADKLLALIAIAEAAQRWMDGTEDSMEEAIRAAERVE